MSSSVFLIRIFLPFHFGIEALEALNEWDGTWRSWLNLSASVAMVVAFGFLVELNEPVS